MIRPGGRLYEQSHATWEELDKLSDCISYVKNAAGLYVFPKIKKEALEIVNDREFAHQLLLNKHILLVPGSGFAWPDPDHFRIVMLPQPDDLRLAVREMGDFIRESGAKGLTFA
jgi:alanine-synthesizing transaminase